MALAVFPNKAPSKTGQTDREELQQKSAVGRATAKTAKARAGKKDAKSENFTDADFEAATNLISEDHEGEAGTTSISVDIPVLRVLRTLISKHN